MRQKWDEHQVEDFRQWHKRRLEQLGYPEEIVAELSRTRENFLAKVGGRKASQPQQ